MMQMNMDIYQSKWEDRHYYIHISALLKVRDVWEHNLSNSDPRKLGMMWGINQLIRVLESTHPKNRDNVAMWNALEDYET